MMMVCLSSTKLLHFFIPLMTVNSSLPLTIKSAEDAIAEQAKPQEEDPNANLSKKEKKKKKKQVLTMVH